MFWILGISLKHDDIQSGRIKNRAPSRNVGQGKTKVLSDGGREKDWRHDDRHGEE